MPPSRLEDLPNELLRQIFSELSLKDLLKSWLNINTRFNRLIFSLDYKICLIKRNVTEDDFRAALVLRRQVVSLVVTKRWCSLINYFLYIRALRIMGFAYPFSFSHIKPILLPLLKYIECSYDDFSWNSFMGADGGHYARQILQCYARRLTDIPNISCQTLLRIKLIVCTNEGLASLLRVAPNLIDLDIGVYKDISIDLAGMQFCSISTTSEANEHPAFTPTPSHYFEDIHHYQLRQIKLQFDCDITLKWLDSFLRCTPYVTHFSLDIPRSNDVFSFVEFHRIISQHLPNLIQQKFRFKYCCLPKPFDLEQHRNIGPLFRTMITKTYEHRRLALLIISVNWKNDDSNEDDEYDDDDDEDDVDEYDDRNDTADCDNDNTNN